MPVHNIGYCNSHAQAHRAIRFLSGTGVRRAAFGVQPRLIQPEGKKPISTPVVTIDSEVFSKIMGCKLTEGAVSHLAGMFLAWYRLTPKLPRKVKVVPTFEG